MKQQWRMKIVDHSYFFEQFEHCPMLVNQGDWRQGLSQQVPTSPLWIHKDHEYWGILMMRKMMLMLMVRMEGHNVDSISKPMLIKISPSASFHQGGSLSCKEFFIRLAPDINGPVHCPNWKSCIMNIRCESIMMGNLLVLIIWGHWIHNRLRLWVCVFYWKVSLLGSYLLEREKNMVRSP